jgi:hypothetical protein
MIASALFGLLWIAFAIFIALVIPRFGIASPTDLSNPSILLPALQQHPPMLIFPGLDMLLGASLVFLSVAVAGRAQDKVAASYGLPLGVVSGASFILLATNRVVTLPLLAKIHETNAATATSLFQVVNAGHDGLAVAIRITLSLWLLVMAIATRNDASGRAVCISLALCSLVNAIGLLILPVSGLNILLFPILAGLLIRWFWEQGETV